MRFSPATLLCLLAGTVVADTAGTTSSSAKGSAKGSSKGFTIPKELTDGVYSVQYDTNGTAVHTLIGPPISKEEFAKLEAATASSAGAPGKRSSRITARQFDNTGCGGYLLNAANTDAAVIALKSQCNPGVINPGMDFYSISGTTIAYVCNFGTAQWTCSQSGIIDNLAHVTGICGWYMAEWRDQRLNSGSPVYRASTGYEDRDKKFCGRGI